MTIRLIVGLGNPGKNYARTRHNVGSAWLTVVARRHRIALKEQRKFKGSLGRGEVLGRDLRLLLPSTYVNLSGEAVGAVAHFHKIAPAEILVAHDEVAFPPGVCRLRRGGGHNGHNGLRSVIAALGNQRDFARLRIGVGHPGDADAMVGYLTGTTMPATERDLVEQAASLDDATLALVLDGNFDRAMNLLHAPNPAPAGPVRDGIACSTPVGTSANP